MVSISGAASGGFNAGPFSMGGGAGGSASIDGNALGGALADIGGQISELVSNNSEGITNAATAIGSMATEALQKLGGADGLLSGLMGVFGKAAKKLPKFDGAEVRCKMAPPFTPPRPNLKGMMGPELKAHLCAKVGVHNGGFAGEGRLRLGNVRADGSFSVEGGSVPVPTLIEMREIAKIVVGGRFSDLAKFGIDLVSKCASNPLLSALLSKLPRGLDFLLKARGDVQGGFAHFMAFFGFRMEANICVNANTEAGQASPSSSSQDTGEASRPSEGTRNGDRASILNDPSLSFEDKIFLFCLSIAKEQEDKISKMMADWDAAKQKKGGKAADGDGSTASEGEGGEAPPAGDAGGAAGGSKVGQVVKMGRNAGAGVLGLCGAAAPLVIPALCTAASAPCAAIPGVGPFISAALNVAGPIAGPLVGAMCGVGAMALKSIPFENFVDAIGNKMDGKEGADGVAKKGLFGGLALTALAHAANPLIAPYLVPLTMGAGAVLGQILPTPSLPFPLPGAPGSESSGAQGIAAGGGGCVGPSEQSGQAGGTAGSDAAGKTPSEEGVEDTEKKDDVDSEQRFTQKLAHEQQALSKIYEMVSNMMKASHDTQMASIRNMR